MNIQQVMRGFIGDFQTGEAKMLELKAGQVVKGTVVQLLDGQEAIVTINGMQVRAKLETPLAQGQSTMLQVQPESPDGQMVLKPLQSSSIPIETGSLADLIKGYGMKDSLGNRQLIQQMHQEGVLLSKENVQGFLRTLAGAPANIISTEWIQSAILADKRGLPLTTATVSALHQVVFGTPMHQALNQLNEQLTMDLKSGTSISPTLKASLAQLQDTIKQIQTISSNYSNQLISDQAEQTREANPIEPSKANQSTDKQTVKQANVNFNANSSIAPPLNNSVVSSVSLENAILPKEVVKLDTKAIVQGSVQSDTGLINKGGGLSDTPETSVNILQNSAASKILMNTANNLQANAAVNTQSIDTVLPQGTPVSNTQGTPTVLPTNDSTLLQSQDTALAAKSGLIALPVTTGENQTDMINRMLKAVGFEHENQVVKLLGNLQLNSEKTYSNLLFGSPQMGENMENTLFKRDANSVTDTLKSLLLQLSSANELPAALKENMQQLLQQVTGQQLFAIPDRTSMFSHITLFLPLTNANGEQTASVHVQSRRGKKGELDANNCRLLFDLHMKVLGETVVDVQVVNRIVALQVHNDHPFISEILEFNRKEIAAAVEKVGYQFLSMKSKPFSIKEDAEGLLPKHEINNTAARNYSSKPYKGVDVRI